jgi:PIN domain nuclease of toxin-antitoxin system
MTALDASALLAFLFREPGHEAVAEVLDSSCMSAVNLAEVIGRFVRDGHDSRMVQQRLVQSPISFVPFTTEDAAIAAALIPHTQPFGLSFGHRACLALAQARGIPVLTADRVWQEVDCGVTIQLIR